jgi:aspartate carbamoyltransferase catalytic subunit
MAKKTWKRKGLLGLEELTREEIELILEQAQAFKEVSTRPIKKVPALRGKTVVLFFVEPSTRTRISFELAAKRLSADIIGIQASASSLTKGETLIDTIKNIEAYNVDIIVMRHYSSGASHMVAQHARAAIVNAGDGSHEHPTQALLDIFTIKEKKGKIQGLNISIIGDILHSRVARSNIWGLNKLGAHVTLCAPPTLIPKDIEKLGVTVTYDLKAATKNADVCMFLRLQLERQKEKFLSSLEEYAMFFGLDEGKVKALKNDVIIMHPGPINRGVELSPEVADGKNSVILDQVTNGLAVRMAVLYLVSGQKGDITEKA